ncbi:aspartate/glutamate racemase family protein [Bradyrhizobium sp. RT11b]|uniref:aspartate/glutamate racemase family protein n=1 Tax=Bradyrhizobium sp. RT11b TaxID=3156332 RepID=UPI0033913F62
MAQKTLGILELENEAIKLPGFLAGPGTFHFPVKRITVPGATAKNVTEGDHSVSAAYVRCAKQLESEGVAAITTNCGFTSVFHAEVAAAVSIPIALSSLILVPQLARTLPAGRRIGIVTFNARNLTEHHFAGAGWSSKDIAVSAAGIEGSESWHEMLKPVPAPTVSAIVRDVMTATRSLLASNPDIAALVLECAGFPVAGEAVRCETGLPVADFVTLANTLIEMSPARKAQRSSQGLSATRSSFTPDA